jgi:hypothetical protein
MVIATWQHFIFTCRASKNPFGFSPVIRILNAVVLKQIKRLQRMAILRQISGRSTDQPAVQFSLGMLLLRPLAWFA